jgi:DNA polymerase-3 subunit epsilon
MPIAHKRDKGWDVYAVVDTETTGLNPGLRHRIAEVAVVHVDADGRLEREWSTLINPQRDLGPQRVHGIRAAEVRRAPTFHQVAGQLADLLEGRMIVAHNLPFDLGFLNYEFGRVGVDVPLSVELGLCTMRLAPHYLHDAGRSLRDCCLAAGVPQHGQHDALSDARAAAGLLRVFLSATSEVPPWESIRARACECQWPDLPILAVEPMTRSATYRPDEHFLSRLVGRLPRVPDPPQSDDYLAVLDRALIDRHISASEADELTVTARDLGLDRAAVVTLHRDYLAALAIAALADGVVTDDERHDLATVACLLGLSADDADTALEATPTSTEPSSASFAGRFGLQPGDLVVLTGQMTEPREVWENRAFLAGLNVGANVTKKTRLLVAADPDSLSGKARKARDYGIPVVTEDAFANLVARLRHATAGGQNA